MCVFLYFFGENISISVKDDNIFGMVFPLSVITLNSNRIKISKVCFWHHYQFITNHTFKLAKRKCRRISEDTNEVEGEPRPRRVKVSQVTHACAKSKCVLSGVKFKCVLSELHLLILGC